MKKGQTLVISFVSLLLILFLFIQFFMKEYNQNKKPAFSLDEVEEEAVRLGKQLQSASAPTSLDRGRSKPRPDRNFCSPVGRTCSYGP